MWKKSKKQEIVKQGECVWVVYITPVFAKVPCLCLRQIVYEFLVLSHEILSFSQIFQHSIKVQLNIKSLI